MRDGIEGGNRNLCRFLLFRWNWYQIYVFWKKLVRSICLLFLEFLILYRRFRLSRSIYFFWTNFAGLRLVFWVFLLCSWLFRLFFESCCILASWFLLCIWWWGCLLWILCLLVFDRLVRKWGLWSTSRLDIEEEILHSKIAVFRWFLDLLDRN